MSYRHSVILNIYLIEPLSLNLFLFGRNPLSYPETIVRDNNTDIPDLVNITENRNHWKRLVDSHLDRGRRK